jgi:tRNA(His) 5'-end guanylyltransferase
MIETTQHLVEHTGALIGYTQSDEITLIFYHEDLKSQMWFDGREQKMVSQLGAQATLAFNKSARKLLPDFVDRDPTFDARVFQVPNKVEAVNTLVWREWDATKNSISMAASHYFNHRELQSKNADDKLNMLRSVGINWSDYPPAFKRGTYVKRALERVIYTLEELAALPPKHRARTHPDEPVIRHRLRVLEVPPITKIQNRVAWVFDGEEPVHA